MGQDLRKLPRERRAFDAVCRANGRAYPVRLSEISKAGCRAEMGTNPTKVGSRVVLELDPLVTLRATVRWTRVGQAGLSFANPLHGAMLLEFAARAKRARSA